MAFVYENMTEKDKKWLDFSQFKGLVLGKPYSSVGAFRRWTIDRDRGMALVFIDCIGRVGGDGYEINGCGFYYQGRYINFTIRYTEIDKGETYTAKWFDANFNFTDENEEKKIEIIKFIKEALIAYTRRGSLSHLECVIDF